MLEDLLTIGFLAVLATLMVADVVRPARKFPVLRHWRLKGVLYTLAFLCASFTLPLLWDAWLGERRLLDLRGLGTIGGALVGLLGYQLIGYWWHRALHGIPWLWRIHQMHHSAERIDIFGANVFHPLDILGWTFVPSFSLVMVFGVTPGAAAIAGTISAALALLGHANIETPAWLGYLFQRPENHATHHERGVHAHNYGDIALWDMVFGTWRNPETWNGAAGFYDGASRRVGHMLLGLDVTRCSKGADRSTDSSAQEPARAGIGSEPAQSGSYAQ
jgi:sterol desaturase/sphingolipid hydroxylase (fatty acid hydroxylase superfamily)